MSHPAKEVTPQPPKPARRTPHASTARRRARALLTAAPPPAPSPFLTGPRAATLPPGRPPASWGDRGTPHHSLNFVRGVAGRAGARFLRPPLATRWGRGCPWHRLHCGARAAGPALGRQLAAPRPRYASKQGPEIARRKMHCTICRRPCRARGRLRPAAGASLAPPRPARGRPLSTASHFAPPHCAAPAHCARTRSPAPPPHCAAALPRRLAPRAAPSRRPSSRPTVPGAPPSRRCAPAGAAKPPAIGGARPAALVFRGGCGPYQIRSDQIGPRCHPKVHSTAGAPRARPRGAGPRPPPWAPQGPGWEPGAARGPHYFAAHLPARPDRRTRLLSPSL